MTNMLNIFFSISYKITKIHLTRYAMLNSFFNISHTIKYPTFCDIGYLSYGPVYQCISYIIVH